MKRLVQNAVTTIALFCLPTVVGAAPSVSSADAQCFTQEIDPQTRRIYQNEAQWKADREKLWKNSPSLPSYIRLAWGYRVAQIEMRNSRGIGSDKRKHCYVGCRIANDVGHDVAVIAGYHKEDKDLLDCDPKTHFDLADLAATIRGADLALTNPKKANKAWCRKECRRTFK